ncbi:hypothetical protein HPP92_006792 [Vanilla planifolia]|uniref:3-deoxy-D-manno-octulosonic-acid transferase N-terminal domain-containing protein n=1 Tax=Vanilla planifolia TaxID=51239 RepID=A0A835RF41_VANPL|nr:hypothetical protein HPP92_006792 [Vanilla planifolia]
MAGGVESGGLRDLSSGEQSDHPFLYLHLHWRRIRGLEHWSRWPERFGRPSAPRPPGSLIWFHAVSLGEGLAAVPVIQQCLLENPHLLVLMTTTTLSAFEVIKGRLPNSVIYQFAPVDTPTAMESFLMYWSPIASTVEAIRFQLLNASPFIINFVGDLKYAVLGVSHSMKEKKGQKRVPNCNFYKPADGIKTASLKIEEKGKGC